MIATGAAQVRTGATGGAFTTSVWVAVAVVYRVRSFGVKVTERVCVPTASTVPAAGL